MGGDICVTVATRVRTGAGRVSRGLTLNVQPLDLSAGPLVGPQTPRSARFSGHVRDTSLNRTASRSIVSHDYSRVSRSIRGPARDFRGRRSLNRGYIRARGDLGPWVTEGTAQIHRCADENRVYLHQGTCGRVDGDSRHCKVEKNRC